MRDDKGWREALAAVMQDWGHSLPMPVEELRYQDLWPYVGGIIQCARKAERAAAEHQSVARDADELVAKADRNVAFLTTELARMKAERDELELQRDEAWVDSIKQVMRNVECGGYDVEETRKLAIRLHGQAWADEHFPEKP